MIASPFFKGKTIFILGLGRSGRSAAQSLRQAGAQVLAWDDQKEARQSACEQGIPLANLERLNWKEIDHFILSPGIPHRYPVPHPISLQAQNAGLSPINDLELLYRSQPDVRYIGITGTNGKSTTTSLIAHILKESGKPVDVGGNLGIPAMDLKPLPQDGTYVLEVSSYQLETAPTLHFDISVLLNITPDHLERHGGLEGYINTKKLIYKNATPQDTLVISVDDEPCRKIYEELKASSQMQLIPVSVERVLSEGISVIDGMLYENQEPITPSPFVLSVGPVGAEVEGWHDKESCPSFDFGASRLRSGRTGNDNFDLNTLETLRGKHNWQNVAAAYGALRAMGLHAQDIMSGIASFPGLAHRQEVVGHYENVLFVNDSKATNAEAAEKALNSYADHSIYWLLGGRPKEGGITSLKPYFSKIRHAFIFGEATPLFVSTLKGQMAYTICQSLEEAVKNAAALAWQNQEPDAVVLLAPACASFDQFKDFEARGNIFCQAVKDVIEWEQNEQR